MGGARGKYAFHRQEMGVCVCARSLGVSFSRIYERDARMMWSPMKAGTPAVPRLAQPTALPRILPAVVCASSRPRVRGKFLCADGEKLYVRAVTYGPFHPDRSGNTYPEVETLENDFSLMAAHGVNAIRTYNAPPCEVLDIAQSHGLRVIVGLQGERHFAFLDDSKAILDIKEKVRAGVRRSARHPAVLCYTLANEIPAHIVRWHGARRVERFIEDLFWIAKSEDPDGLFTYANYPTTEYLHLPFLDLVCFNVFLESQRQFEAYLVRLQNLAGDRPLIMSEIGLDSRRNGEAAQAKALAWQIRTAFAMGCAGVSVFSWTDEWHNRGGDVEDWDFGVTDRKRTAKPALNVLREAFAEVPFSCRIPLPRVSVVVCTFNGSRTIRECLDGLQKLRYPNFEVIVIDDGSTDGAGEIAREYTVRVIRTENHGLSSARNTGLEAATGEIVAYLDDDASPDPHWLHYLTDTFLTMNCAGVGGPNLPFPNDGEVAACIAHTPGRPTHVLLSDREAEHIPGCNMAFRRDWLQAIGGSMRNSEWPVTMWTSVGESGRPAESWGSVRRRWSGITAEGRCVRFGSSKWATAKPKQCWKESGRRNTIPAARSPGEGEFTATDCCVPSRWCAAGSTTERGVQQPIHGFTIHRSGYWTRCRPRRNGF